MLPSEVTWPDVEALLVDRLTPLLVALLDPGGARRLGVATDLPPTVEGRWFLRVQAVSGSDDGLTQTSRIDVETFAPTREDAADFAHAAGRALHSLAATARPDGSGLIDRVVTVQMPVWVNYHNPKIHRFAAVYSVAIRPR